MKTRIALAALAAAVVHACPAYATLTSTSNTVSYVGNGSTTVFTVPFKFLANTDLVVTVAGVTQTLTTNYTVNGAGNVTGTVTFGTAPANGSAVVITRTVPLTQTTSLRQNRTFDPATLETALDKLTMEVQQGVQKNAPASLSSLALTAPLSMASGGTGTSSLNCGAGVVTGNGTTLSCTTLSGLAPPGTTGVLLQSSTPGSMQTGHINISGTVRLGNAGATISATGFSGASGILVADSTNANVGNIRVGGCSANGPCLQSQFGPLYLGMASGTSGVIIDTMGANHTSGNLLQVNNNTVSKFAVDTAGVATSAGLTSSGPVSGTTGTFSSTLTVTGTSTHTGATALNGGATIGSGGTAISKSVRGTTTWNPGTVTSQAMVSTSITVTGAVTGADCIAGVTSPAPLSGFPVQCIVTAPDTCGIAIINQQSVSQAFGSATFYCRVFNP